MKKLKKTLSFTTFIVMLGMVICVSWQIWTRYVLNNPSVWTEEATRICLIYMTFLGSGLAMLRGDEIKVTMLVNKFNPAVQTSVEFVMNILSLVFLGVVFWYAFPLMIRLASQDMPALHISKALVYLALPLGSLGMAVVLGERTISSFKRIFHDKKQMEVTG